MSDNLKNVPEKYPCPICGELKRIGISKKEKPYYFCDLCGVQVFIRGKMGIQKLIELNKSDFFDRIKPEYVENTLEIIQLENQISFLKDKIERFSEADWWAGPSRQQKMILERLKSKLKALENQYFEKLSSL